MTAGITVSEIQGDDKTSYHCGVSPGHGGRDAAIIQG
jgi:hypothetical protein